MKPATLTGAAPALARPGRLRIEGNPWVIVLICLVPLVAYYHALICLNYGDFLKGPYAGPALFRPVNYGFTFNSMLLHLLHGRFDVDPQAIGLEGTIRDGLSYSYFGVVPALLRLPFLLARDFAATDYTRLGCLVAVSIMGAFNLASVLTVWRAAAKPERWPLLVIVIVGLLLSGAQIQFLMASIWQEVTLWAAAIASAFVYLVVRGLHREAGFTPGLFAGLAAVAGLCLLTRVSTALGLYVVLGLLMLRQLWKSRGSAAGARRVLIGIAPAVAILAAFIAAAAIVNYGRWGNPLAFAGDMRGYLLGSTDRQVRDAVYGPFNVVRIGYALAYYFVPVWAMHTGDGTLLWSDFQRRTIDSVELPPSSFFLSDPLLVGLAVFGLTQVARNRLGLDRTAIAAAFAGLLVPIGFILTFSSMTFRYRLEFYPFLDLAAFVGFGALLSRAKPPRLVTTAGAALVGIVSSHILMTLYALGRFGNAAERLAGMDVVSFYKAFFH